MYGVVKLFVYKIYLFFLNIIIFKFEKVLMEIKVVYLSIV